ncbi:uncharacterized protein LOC103940032 [Pyrus x bretschneideri]|uniref:uncharacterized protein LOC103940032 n=1 Tax=Pyrus x bretschneideri TaxID=225117 RepID=UPI0020308BEE|nr:uncharacterized protein LOC103940032 [Pyrus x bretschneideri]
MNERFKDEERSEEIFQEVVFVLWRICRSRNAAVFKGDLKNPMEAMVILRQHLQEYRNAQPTKKVLTPIGQAVLEDEFAGARVRWRRPLFGTLKVICDGAWSAKTMRGGYGWVMRDFAGILKMAGGAGGCFFNNAAVVEAAAVRAALIFYWEQGCSKVEIESDAQSLVKMINGEVSTDATFDCNLFLTPQLEEVKFLFVPRSGNMVARAVASHTPGACF